MATLNKTTDTWTPEGRRFLEQMKAVKKGPIVKVGVLAEKGSVPKRERTKTGEKDGDATLVEVAVYNEFGTSDGRVPERSFIRYTADANKDEWAKFSDKLRAAVVQGRATVEWALGIMGERIKSDIQARIRSNVPPENKPSTIARKRGSTGTLRNLGQLLNSISYELGDKRDGER